jgi:hypothetical protein
MYEIKAKTEIYKGILFKSKLEAKWAKFFDACGWKWEYEPMGLDGWIPNFVLYGNKTVLCEVKPHKDYFRTEQYIKAIKKTGKDYELLLLTTPFRDGTYSSCCIGILYESLDNDGVIELADGYGILSKGKKFRYDFFHQYYSFEFRMGGEYDGEHYLRPIYWEEPLFNIFFT